MKLNCYLHFTLIFLALSLNLNAVQDTTVAKKVDIIKDDDPFLQMLDNAFLDHCKQSYCDNWYFKDKAGTTHNYAKDSIPVFSAQVYAERLKLLNEKTPINLDYNEYVQAYINAYAKRHKERMERMLGWSEYYYPMFEETLDKYKLPLELKHLAVVESALNPTARSRSGAMGLWQFMYPTGKMFGLHVTSYYDERCDPIMATDAAARYLGYLYNMFGDWHLALAAYNAGPGTVGKAIRRANGEKNYWKLRKFLPVETQNYVPAFIAVNYIMNYAENHNIISIPPFAHFFETDTIHVYEAVSFEKINQITGVEMSHLRFLNPSFTKDLIPKSTGNKQVLRLPSAAIGLFQSNDSLIYEKTIEKAHEEYIAKEVAPSQVYASNNQEKIIHVVKNGEYLSKIASKYACKVEDIKKWNSLKSNYLKVGQKLIIYKKASPPVKAKAPVAKPAVKTEEAKPTEINKAETDSTKNITQTNTNQENLKYKYHTIEKGDTLWKIANSNPGVAVDDLFKWNNFDKNNYKLTPGNKIIIGIDG
jgi:membrane-bound lytic murein transglycosylase D